MIKDSLKVAMIATTYIWGAQVQAANVFGIGSNDVPRLATPIVQTPKSCEDFTGTYIGTCSGNSEIKYLVISQVACEEITVDGTHYNIGAIESQSSAKNNDKSASTSVVQWATSKDLYLTHFGFEAHGGDGALPLVINAKMTKYANTLTVEGTVWDQKVTCNYGKK